MRSIKYLALAALVAFAACDEDDGGGGPAATGTVQVTVTAAGAGIAGVTVSLGAAGSQPAQTNAQGQVTFTAVAVGSYVVSVSGLSADYACSQTSQPVVVGSGLTTSVTFACNLVQTASISGSVSNTDGSPKSGASIAITRTAPAPAGTAVTVTTGTNGQYSLTGLRSGTYSIVLAVTAGCTTAATTQTADLAAGQARVANFTCTVAAPPPPAEPATVAIQSITSGPLGTGVAIPDNAVAGIVNVHVFVNEGGQRVTRVELLIGNQVVGTHTRTVAVPEELQLADFMVSFVVNTAEFNQTTGVPRFFNTASTAGAANNSLLARIYTAAGGSTTSAATATRTIALVNADGASITVTPSSTVIGGTAQTGRAASGLRWWTGNVTIRALPVLYSGHTAASVTITVDGYNTTAHASTSSGASQRAAYLADPLADNSTVQRVLTAAPWEAALLASNSITAGNAATATTRGVGNLEDIGMIGGGAFAVSVTAIRDDNQPAFAPVLFSTVCDDGRVPSPFPPACASGQVPDNIRIDTSAPVIDNVNQLSRWSSAYAWVPPPAPESGQGVTRWINEGYTPEFTTSDTSTTQVRATDRGTGIASSGYFTFEYGAPATAGGPPPATMTAFTSGANLAETMDNNAYFVRVGARDVGGATRQRFNDGTARGFASPLSTDNATTIAADPDAKIGSDHHNPFMQLLGTPGPLLNANMEVIGGAPAGAMDGSAVQAQYIDCHGVVDPATGVCTIDTFTSNPSGFPPNPVRTRIRREFPALTVAAGCWVGDYDGDDNVCNRLGTQAGQSGTTGNFTFGAGGYTTISPTTGAVTTVLVAGDGTVLATNPVGYYRLEMDAVDAAGNLSANTDVRFVRDFTPPTVGGVFFGAVLTPGQPAAFSAGVADDLEVNRGEGFLEVGAPLLAFRQSTTTVGTFGPGDGSIGPAGYTQQATLSSTVTFVHSMQVGTAAPPTQTTRFAFRVSDFGRNSSTAFSGAFPPPTVALRNYTAGAASIAIFGGSETLTSSFPTLCWDTDADGCATTPNTSATLSFTVSGAGSSAAGGPLQIPFSRVEYYVGLDENNDGTVDVDPAGNALWTSLGIAGVSVTENVGATVRTYNWSRNATGTELGTAAGRTSITAGAPIIAANNVWIRVVGYSSDGNSFTVATGVAGCPAPPGGLGASCSIQLTQD